jgi:peptide/nickel transport system ATP-binding protein
MNSPPKGPANGPLLELRHLAVSFATDDGTVHAVDGIDLSLARGRTLGLVGESGCGKSVTSLAIMGLLPPENSKVKGEVRFEGRDLLTLDADTIRDLRGARLAMIFQEPMTSLNPAYTVGDQIVEAIQRHQGLSATDARARAIEMLRIVRIPSPERRVDDYPHKLSGGMRQRAMIAMALACGPELLIADEPTTALDVTIQAQILDLMRGLRRDTGTAIILITHDLGVVAEMADDVAVMYAGQIVERAPVRDLFARPEHPYTVGLLGSIPRLDEKRERLPSIEGRVPDMTRPPVGCRFAARCPFVEPACRDEEPALVEVAPGHLTRCRRAPLSGVAQ